MQCDGGFGWWKGSREALNAMAGGVSSAAGLSGGVSNPRDFVSTSSKYCFTRPRTPQIPRMNHNINQHHPAKPLRRVSETKMISSSAE
jgi:hypothetical protein